MSRLNNELISLDIHSFAKKKGAPMYFSSTLSKDDILLQQNGIEIIHQDLKKNVLT